MFVNVFFVLRFFFRSQNTQRKPSCWWRVVAIPFSRVWMIASATDPFTIPLVHPPKLRAVIESAWTLNSKLARQLRCGKDARVAIIRAPYKIQNPLRTPKYTPKYTPNPPPKPKYRKNTKNIRNWVIFVYFSYFFCISVLEGDLGCISGCILGFRGVLYFVWGTYDRNARAGPHDPAAAEWCYDLVVTKWWCIERPMSSGRRDFACLCLFSRARPSRDAILFDQNLL